MVRARAVTAWETGHPVRSPAGEGDPQPSTQRERPRIRLTKRGWLALALAAALLTTAWFTRLPTLTWAGGALASITVSGIIAALLLPRRIDATITLRPSVFRVGDVAEATLSLAPRRGSVTGMVELRLDRSDPSPSGTVPSNDVSRRVVVQAAKRSRTVVRFQLRGASRGQTLVGPASIASGDPLGLCEKIWTIAAPARCTVTPRPRDTDDDDATAKAEPVQNDDTHSTRGGGAIIDPSQLRDWRAGDAIAHVHWPTSLRQGRLQVRRNETELLPVQEIELDVRATQYPDAHADRGHLVSAVFEEAVIDAASQAAAAAQAGSPLRLIARGDGGRTRQLAAGGLQDVLMALATVEIEERG